MRRRRSRRSAKATAASASTGRRAAQPLVAVLGQGACRTWQVTQLDWLIVAFAAILALLGFRQGFIVGVLSFGGFALGAFLGTRLGPLLLPQGSASPYAPAFGLVGALLGGRDPRERLRGGRLQAAPHADRCPGWGCSTARSARCSASALGARDRVDRRRRRGPDARRRRSCAPTSSARRSCASSTRCCRRPARSSTRSRGSTRCRRSPGPSPDVAPPAPARRARARRAGAPRTASCACSAPPAGWRSRAPAGWPRRTSSSPTRTSSPASRTRRCEVGGRGAEPAGAEPIAFDPTDDIAVLRVPGLGLPALRLAAEPAVGHRRARSSAIPRTGRSTSQAGRIGRTQTVLTAGRLRPGPGLAPADAAARPGAARATPAGRSSTPPGRVLTTVFAGTVGGRPRGGYGVANETVAPRALRRRGRGAGATGPCTAG